MAKIILGTVVTSISGSIGGNTFRRSPYGIILGRKSMGYSRNKLLSNSSLLRLAQVRNVWNNFDPATQNEWKAQALLFTFPDRFGNPIKLTGRMLFIKSYGSLIFADASIPSASDFDTNILEFVTTVSLLDYANEIIEIGVGGFDNNQYFNFAFEIGTNALNAPTFTNRFVCERIMNDSGFGINLYNEFIAQFGIVQIGTPVRLYVTPMNLGGYQGVTQFINFVLA